MESRSIQDKAKKFADTFFHQGTKDWRIAVAAFEEGSKQILNQDNFNEVMQDFLKSFGGREISFFCKYGRVEIVKFQTND